MVHELALISLRKFVTCLGGKCFIVDGTLLGHVREGGFINGDHDIDIGMWIEDYDDRILADLEVAGFKLMRKSGDKTAGLLYMFEDDGIKIDLIFYYRQSDHIWANLYVHGKKLKASYREFDLEMARFKGVDVLIPSPPEQYLVDIYGPNWTQPSTMWSYKYSAHNLKAEGGIAWRCIYWLKRNWKRWHIPEIYSAGVR